MSRINDKKRIDLSIVVPIWNEESAINIYIQNLFPILNRMNIKYEVIFCVDPSTDDTNIVISGLAKLHSNIKAVFFSNRTGQAASTYFGLMHASGKSVIVMDVDLQDPVEMIPTLFQLWQEGHRLVIPIRIARSGEPFTKVLTARFGYWFLNKFANTPIPKNAGDFRLMDEEVVGRLQSLNEYHLFLRGMVSFVGEPAKYVHFSRPKRFVGETKYNRWLGGIRPSLDGILSHTNFPLEFLALVNFFLSTTLFTCSLLLIILSNFSVLLDSLLFMLTLTASSLLLSLGILCLYLARIHSEVKGRPRWIVRNTLNMNESKIDWFDVKRTGIQPSDHI